MKSADAQARGYATEAIEVIADVMRDPLAEFKDRLKAAEIMLERGHGKATQAIIAIPASRRVSEQAAGLTDEELMEIMRGTPLPRLTGPDTQDAEFEEIDPLLL